MARLFDGARKNWRFVLKFIAFAVGFWLLEIFLQTQFLTPNSMSLAIIRAGGFTAATFFGLALFSSSVFRWFPSYAKYWYVRRSLGVAGFCFLALHAIAAFFFVFNADVSNLLFSLNPLENPVVFGLLAFPVFFAMAMTSTDWAYDKLGFPRWKFIHRFVYIGYYFAVLHFLTINPPALMNAVGYSLLAITFLALAGELYWFIRTVWQKRFSTLGTWVGFALVVLWLVTLYYIYVANFVK